MAGTNNESMYHLFYEYEGEMTDLKTVIERLQNETTNAKLEVEQLRREKQEYNKIVQELESRDVSSKLEVELLKKEKHELEIKSKKLEDEKEIVSGLLSAESEKLSEIRFDNEVTKGNLIHYINEFKVQDDLVIELRGHVRQLTDTYEKVVNDNCDNQREINLYELLLMGDAGNSNGGIRELIKLLIREPHRLEHYENIRLTAILPLLTHNEVDELNDLLDDAFECEGEMSLDEYRVYKELWTSYAKESWKRELEDD